jgi:hypothetical protein
MSATFASPLAGPIVAALLGSGLFGLLFALRPVPAVREHGVIEDAYEVRTLVPATVARSAPGECPAGISSLAT